MDEHEYWSRKHDGQTPSVSTEMGQPGDVISNDDGRGDVTT